MHRENRHECERDKKCNDGEPDEWRGLECKNRGRRHSRWRGSRRSSLPRGGDQRKKREGGAGRGSKVNRGGPQGPAHAASSTVCATRFAKSNGFEREERRV